MFFVTFWIKFQCWFLPCGRIWIKTSLTQLQVPTGGPEFWCFHGSSSGNHEDLNKYCGSETSGGNARFKTTEQHHDHVRVKPHFKVPITVTLQNNIFLWFTDFILVFDDFSLLSSLNKKYKQKTGTNYFFLFVLFGLKMKTKWLQYLHTSRNTNTFLYNFSFSASQVFSFSTKF